MTQNTYIGVEIGGTKQQLALVDGEGTILERISEKVAIPNGASDILRWIEEKLPLLMQKAVVLCIGVGFGGLLESATGTVTTSIQVKGWQGICLKDWFEARFHIPTVVVNDTVAGGYGELCCGTGRGKRTFFYTNIGTGIGGVMFIDGRPYDGIGFGSSYFGHTYIPNPETGGPSKVENLCCGVAMERRLRSPGAIPEDSVMYGLDHPSCADLGRAAAAGDAFALTEIDRWAESYAIGMSNLITLFSPERVSIGGGVANLGELLLAPVRKRVDEFVFLSARGRYDIVRCYLMDDAVIVGAAMFGRDGFHPL